LSNDGVAWGDWLTIQDGQPLTVSWTLANDGTNKPLYLRLQDDAGRVAQVITSTIAKDTIAPNSTMTLLPPSQYNPILLSWSGTDATSGLASYDLEMRIGTGGSWQRLLSATTQTTYELNGVVGNTYYFRVRARDVAGNVENWPASFDTFTTIAATPTPTNTPTDTPTSTNTPTPTDTPTASATPTSTPTSTATSTASPEPTASATLLASLIQHLPIVIREIGPTPTVGPTATIEPTATTEPGVYILPNTSAIYLANQDKAFIFGEAINTTGVQVTAVAIQLNVYNQSGQLTDFEVTFLQLPLAAGDRSCFGFVYPGAGDKTFTLMDPTYVVGGPTIPDLTILSSQLSVPSNATYVSGDLRNDDSFRVDDVRVIGTFYDPSGNVVGCSDGINPIPIGFLDPGEVAYYETVIFNTEYAQSAVTIDSFRVQPTGRLPGD
ncbi:MAG: fibronectin type III domain-containing protein, partial [Anaerolineales bacterium]|nr:fibronectin type III domain-containing protein [Anaerolineales bacterium]